MFIGRIVVRNDKYYSLCGIEISVCIYTYNITIHCENGSNLGKKIPFNLSCNALINHLNIVAHVKTSLIPFRIYMP